MTWIDVTSPEAVHQVHDRMANPPTVVPTGLPTVDSAMWLWGDRRGVPGGTYMIVGGASNIGKTQFALHMLRQAAGVGLKAAMISMDMRPRDSLVRVHQALTVGRIPFDHWVPSRWRPEYERVLQDALVAYRTSVQGAVAIYDGMDRDLDKVAGLIEDAVRVGASFVVVDHLQNIRVKGFGDDNISDRAQIVSEAMEWLARRHDVTICALSQLNRTASSQKDRRPCMQDLWGGTAMESNSGIVILLDHSRYKRDEQRHQIGRTYVLLDKSQIGPKGFAVPVEWNHATLGLREAMPDELNQWPTGR
jgi:replicative DNA helicase